MQIKNCICGFPVMFKGKLPLDESVVACLGKQITYNVVLKKMNALLILLEN